MSRLRGRYTEVQDQSLNTYEGSYEGDGFGYYSQHQYGPGQQDIGHDHEDTVVPRSPGRQYKPTTLRWPFLITLLLALLTTLAFLIYATVSLPVVRSNEPPESVKARDLQQPSDSIIQSVTLQTRPPTIGHKTRRMEGATYRDASPTSIPSNYARTESRDVETRAGVEMRIIGAVDPSATIHAVTPGVYGSIEAKTATVAPQSTTADTIVTTLFSNLESNFGKIGTKTDMETLPYTTTTTCCPALPENEFGRVGTKTVTEAPPDTTTSTSETYYESKPESDFGRIGTKTITEASPYITTITKETSLSSSSTPGSGLGLPGSDFGIIGTKTVTDSPLFITIGGTTTETPESPQSGSEFGKSESKVAGDQLTDSMINIETVTYLTIGPTTISGTDGSPITTSIEAPSLISSLQTHVLTNSEGQVTATQIATVTVTPSVFVKTDSSGNPTATVISYPITPSAHTSVYVINAGHYFMGKFLPILVASILGVIVQILDTNVKYFQPWHALTHEQGALGRDSLCLETGGWGSLVMGLRSLAGGHPVTFLASFLSISSAILTSVSAGAITLDLRGDGCRVGGSSASNCAYVLSVSPIVAKVTIGILAVMSLATIFLVVIVGRWRLGVYTNPWSMCTLASLSANPDVQRRVLDAATGPDRLKDQDFKLDYYHLDNGHTAYGVVAFDRLRNTEPSAYESETAPLTSKLESNESRWKKRRPPFFMLGIIGRMCLLLILSGALTLILYYAQTGGDTAFERFIDSESFGVQFLFTSLGVIINLFWSSFFNAVAIMTPYQVLREGPQEAGQSVLLAPPTNAFSGLWHAARTRRLFLGVVSLASLLSLSLSIFLSNVPFQVTHTFLVYQLSLWTSVGIMSSMFLVLLASFFVRWPSMPVEPTTIAGAMYYVCNSSASDTFAGLSTLPKKERDRTLINMALLYELGDTTNAARGSSIGLKLLQPKDLYSGLSYYN